MEHEPVEDVFPIENGDFPASYVGLPEGKHSDMAVITAPSNSMPRCYEYRFPDRASRLQRMLKETTTPFIKASGVVHNPSRRPANSWGMILCGVDPQDKKKIQWATFKTANGWHSLTYALVHDGILSGLVSCLYKLYKWVAFSSPITAKIQGQRVTGDVGWLCPFPNMQVG